MQAPAKDFSATNFHAFSEPHLLGNVAALLSWQPSTSDFLPHPCPVGRGSSEGPAPIAVELPADSEQVAFAPGNIVVMGRWFPVSAF